MKKNVNLSTDMSNEFVDDILNVDSSADDKQVLEVGLEFIKLAALRLESDLDDKNILVESNRLRAVVDELTDILNTYC